MTKIKLFATDVDGTMTDAGMYYTEDGIELKKFNFRDGMGFKLLREAGIKTAIITSETSAMVKKRADKLKVDYLSMGSWEKLDFVKNICKDLDITLDEVAYVGDDINDIAAFECVTYKIAPKNANPILKLRDDIQITQNSGGYGAFREVVDELLNS